MYNLEWQKIDKSNFETVPKKSGVYIITCKCVSGEEHVIYSGQSDNLCRRLKEHWNDSEENEELKRAIKNYPSAIEAYYSLVPLVNLDCLERYLFDTFLPQLQERAPEVSASSCTLPKNVSKGRVNFKAN